MLVKNFLCAAGCGAPGGEFFGPSLTDKFLATDTWIQGAFALEQGFIFSAMFLAAATVEVIERRFLHAAAWCLASAALSAVGLLHAYAFTPGDTRLACRHQG